MEKRDDRRSAVRKVQRWLLTLYNAGMALPEIVPDGVYDTKTANAVSVFQGLCGIPITGKVDLETWRALNGAANEAEKKARGSEPIFPFDAMKENGRIVMGEHCDLLYVIQVMLRTLETHYPGITNQEISGSCDSRTADNVRYLQRLWGLPETGDVDEDTWNMMACCYNMFLNRE